MKRVLCVTLLCLLMAGLMGCGEVVQPEATTTTKATLQTIALGKQWGVTIERIDLSKPENKKYIDWAKGSRYSKNFSAPEYFDVEPYWQAYQEMWEEERKLWTTCDLEDEAAYKLQESCRPWNEAKELVIRSTYEENEWDGFMEFLVRDKATGETQLIAKGHDADYDGVVFDTINYLSDTRVLYHMWYWDGGDWGYYIYDLEIGESICVTGGDLCDLGNGRYLWIDQRYVNVDSVSTLHLIDMRAFESGKKGAKSTLVNWGDDYSASITHLSSDKRFVYVYLHRLSDYARLRGVYDVNTGEQIALFEMPDVQMTAADGWGLINDELEYIYNWAGNVEDPDILWFYVIRYDRTGE